MRVLLLLGLSFSLLSVNACVFDLEKIYCQVRPMAIIILFSHSSVCWENNKRQRLTFVNHILILQWFAIASSHHVSDCVWPNDHNRAEWEIGLTDGSILVRGDLNWKKSLKFQLLAKIFLTPPPSSKNSNHKVCFFKISTPYFIIKPNLTDIINWGGL